MLSERDLVAVEEIVWSTDVILALVTEAQEIPLPTELETKIPAVDSEAVARRLAELKAEVIRPEHLLVDHRFKRDSQSTVPAGGVQFDMRAIVPHRENARHFFMACALLGLQVAAAEKSIVTLLPADEAVLPGRNVRLRYDGVGCTLTVKQEVERGEQLVLRAEVPVVLHDPELVKLMLTALAYRQNSRREKKNTVYRLGKALVELRQAPHVPALVEIEGRKKKHIYRALEALGFTKFQATSMSDGEYLRAYLPPEQQDYIDNLHFTDTTDTV